MKEFIKIEVAIDKILGEIEVQTSLIKETLYLRIILISAQNFLIAFNIVFGVNAL